MNNCIEVDGIRFYQTKQGYWFGGTNKKAIRLHIYVWEKEHGKCPKGYSIHHKDHNRNNNAIENLELMKTGDHLSMHMNMRDKQGMRDNLEDRARPEAVKWHGSDVGRAWHKKHYEEQKGVMHTTKEVTCQYCGKTSTMHTGGGGHGNKFCSDNCKYLDRVARGLYMETKPCERCGKEHTSLKNNKTRFCSLSCATRSRYENIRDQKGRE